MKRKYFLVGLFLMLAMLLVGCGSGIITPATDEEKVKSVIQEYFSAINDQDWSKAKSYCVYGSDVYEFTCVLEDGDAFYGDNPVLTIIFSVDILDVSISGSYATAYTIVTTVTTTDEGSYSDSGLWNIYLQEVDNNWEIDSSN